MGNDVGGPFLSDEVCIIPCKATFLMYMEATNIEVKTVHSAHQRWPETSTILGHCRNPNLQTRSNPLPKLPAGLSSLLRSRINIQMCIMRLIIPNHKRSIRKYRLPSTLAKFHETIKLHQNHQNIP